MLINWFTVIAQVVNFLILVWLLKRFLYKPVLRAIDAREKHIADQIQAAQKQEEDAAREQAEFEEKNKSFDAQKSAMLEKVEAEAGKEKQKLLEEARTEAATLRKNLADAWETNRISMEDAVSQKTKEEVLHIAAKALQDLAGDDLGDRMVAMLIRRLQNSTDTEKQKIRDTLGNRQDIEVHSANTLSDTQKESLQNSMDEIVKTGKPLQFIVDTSLRAGITLRAGGYIIAWSLDEYLEDIGRAIDDAMENGLVENENKTGNT